MQNSEKYCGEITRARATTAAASASAKQMGKVNPSILLNLHLN